MDLKLDARYEVDDDLIARGAGIPVGDVDHPRGLHHYIAFPGGQMVLQAMVRFAPKWRSTSKEHLHIELANSVTIRELPFDYVQESIHEKLFAMPYGDGVLYLHFSGADERGFYLPLGSTSDPQPVEIISPLRRLDSNPSPHIVLRPGHFDAVVFENNVAAVPVANGHKRVQLAFLTVDPANWTASWSTWLPVTPTPAPGLFQRLFGARDTEPSQPAAPARLSPQDFPYERWQADYQPLILKALLRNSRVYIYTMGHTDSLGHGFPCSVLAEIGSDGRAIAKPFLEDYTGSSDSKKRGIYGEFTSSGRYCILTSTYQSTDPWNGKQMLFDMDTHQLLDVTLPRGYTKYQLIDHAGDHFWTRVITPAAVIYARFTAA